MFELGKIQVLKVLKKTPIGVYLYDGENEGEKILLPIKQVPKDTEVGDEISVFIYKDSEDRPIATTQTPALTLGGVTVLPVKEVTKIGAFLSWGLTKDLFLPFKQQTYKVKPGDYVLVTLYLDKSERLCASMKVYDLLSTDSPYEKDSTVRGIVYEVSDNFGAFVAVDNRYSGLIPKKELFKQILPGTLIEARVDRVKPDGKLDLSLRERTYLQLEPDSEEILAKLKAAGGYLPFHDKSDAEEIKNFFKMSKAAFKRAIGHLYKDGAIVIEEGGIRLKEE